VAAASLTTQSRASSGVAMTGIGTTRGVSSHGDTSTRTGHTPGSPDALFRVPSSTFLCSATMHLNLCARSERRTKKNVVPCVPRSSTARSAYPAAVVACRISRSKHAAPCALKLPISYRKANRTPATSAAISRPRSWARREKCRRPRLRCLAVAPVK
jgi:hypothetical protein